MQEIINRCFDKEIKAECQGCMFLIYINDTTQERPCDVIKCKNRHREQDDITRMKKDVLTRLECLRQCLLETAKEKGISHPGVLLISQKLDKVLNEFYSLQNSPPF